ncbi:cytochrome C biogenesis protein [Afipia sp. P52-10]|uniref:c-type cytochrome biogenesis protein CcmI n=1 Tax=Afipia sp. P52-10 TaxID=1429916 RepID=UPI0003DF3BE2|nr:c-type cytochrome biogenesis protein CcmI [Afipia sp. P52-10]ETR74717.1 cytochrome C biogenesis protein [Afipia sp. P52-10]
MSLWFVLALMTSVAIFAVLWPLSRSPVSRNDGGGTMIYKDQLAEVERDLSLGIISQADAEIARIEISRRLLSVANSPQAEEPVSRVGLRRAIVVMAFVGIPVFAGILYLQRGSPTLKDFPLAGRMTEPVASASLETLVTQVEAHLEKNPRDGRGWEVLAPVLLRLGRIDDAVRAYRNSLAYGTDTAVRRADLGEALAAAAGGVITSEAKAEFERALQLDAKDPKARYFMAVAAEQDGRANDAATIWRDMLKTAPDGAPWRPAVEQALARVNASIAPELSNEAVAASKDMTADERSEMIAGMVDRLAARLKQNGDDVEGWLRLVRAYTVLGQAEKAKQAISDARSAAQADPERLRRFNDALKNLGLEG